MSTAKFDTLSTLDGSRSVPVNTVAQGSAKAWVNFNGTGTVAIRAAFNVSSITDLGTGNYRVNFTNALADANYGVVCTTSSNSSGTSTMTIATSEPSSTRTASAFGIYTFSGAGASFNDFDVVSAAVFR